MKIGIFDSGLGGLSVLNEALNKLSEHEFLYYADVKNVPYGQKSRDEILKFSFDAVKFLVKNGAKAVVVACNTATSVAIKELRANLSVPIIGMEPAVKKALTHDAEHRVLVTATPITVHGEKLKRLISSCDPNGLVDLLALPRLVEFAERQEFVSSAVEAYLRDAFAPYRFADYSAIVLGCTHFNYFKDTMRQLLPQNVRLVDGNEGTVEELARRTGLRTQPIGAQTAHCTFFASGRPVVRAEELAHMEADLARAARMEEIV